MGILAFGINHKSASVDLRGQIAFAPEIVVESLKTALVEMNVAEIALLSTCNRTEIYLHGEVSDEQLLAWLADTKGLETEELAVLLLLPSRRTGDSPYDAGCQWAGLIGLR